MSVNLETASPTGQKKIVQGKEQSGSGVPPLNPPANRRAGQQNQRRDASATLTAPVCHPERSEGSLSLPAGWTRTTLGDVTEDRVEQSGPPGRGEFIYVDISSIDNKAKRIIEPKTLPVAQAPSRAKQNLKAGDVLISMTRPNLNAVALVPPELDGAVGSTGFHVLRSRDAEPAWLFNTVQNTGFIDAMCQVVQGALYPAVRPKDIRAFPLPLPPLPEQRRIVAEIEKQFTRLEAGVAALRRVQASLHRYRAAVLKAACEGRLVPTEAELQKSGSGILPLALQHKNKRQDAASTLTFESGAELLVRILAERRQRWLEANPKSTIRNRKYVEPAAPNTAKLPATPEGWTIASVDQLADETMIGLDRGRAQQGNDPSSGMPYIKMNNVTMDGRVFCDKLVYVPASCEEGTRFAVQDGDILFNTRNSKELVGKVGLVRNPPAGAIYNNNLMRIRLAGGVSPAFLTLQMCSHEFRRHMELVKKATTNVAAVYAKDLLPLAIALPPPAEQTRIVAEVERRLSVVEELEFAVANNLQRATRLRQSVLQRAFEGKLL
ncbi:MAG: restriction endonuclease subunit S [Verrucomicrobia bacterium]|nr:restriction endonuclease subunit S [Verrucomicrobiota bacterium]